MKLKLIEAIIKNNQEEILRILDTEDKSSAKRIIDEVEPSSESGVLHYAALYGRTHLIEILVKSGAEINKKDKQGSTPLFIAAQNRNAATAAKLLECRADKNIPNHSGMRPVHIAAASGFTPSYRYCMLKEKI